MLYFEGITTPEEAKAKYRELAKQYHPDLCGSVEIMKAINAQYDEILLGIYQTSGKSITEIEELLADALAVRIILAEFSINPLLVIELCGTWIWITGETRAVKEELKQAGFRWSPNKLAWYWRRDTELKRSHRYSWDMEKIRNYHGQQKISNLKQYSLIA